MPSANQESIASVASPQPVTQTNKALPRPLRKMLALDDFEAPARRYLPRPIYSYVADGSETNSSVRGNRSAYQALSLVPRILVNTAERTQQTTLFGRTYDAPFGFAPMGGISLAAYRGDLVFARTAAAANIPMILSGASLTSLETVRQAGHTVWFQAYLPGEAGQITQLVNRIVAAGYDTLCLTVDVPVGSNRENAVRAGFDAPLRPSLRLAWDCSWRPRWLLGALARTLLLHGMPHYENMPYRIPIISRTGERSRAQRDILDWKHLELMRRLWKGRLLVKGILSKQDARIARDCGADGIIVSNHGGRQLDSAVAPLRVLPGIVEQAGDMPVMIDGGIRRGADVLKALALGARFVFIGRPFMYAAAVGGDAALLHAVKLLKEEIHRNMALLGIAKLSEISHDHIMPADNFDGFAAKQ